MKSFIALAILIAVSSCSQHSKREKDAAEIKPILEKFIQDFSFKQDHTIKIYQFDILNVDTLPKVALDAFFVHSAQTYRDRYDKVHNEYLEKSQASLNDMRLYSMIKSRDLLEIGKSDVKKYTNLAGQYVDSMLAINRMDSAIATQADRDTSIKNYLYVKTFFKGTEYAKKDSSNTMDTLYFWLTKDRQVIDVRSRLKDSINKYYVAKYSNQIE